MAKPYAVPNNVSGVLTSNYVHGTDNHLHLVAIGLFATGGGYVRVYTTGKLHWADLEYTGVSSNDLTGLTLCTGGNVESDAAYTFPAGSIVARVPMGQDVSELITGPASATSGHFFKANGTSGKLAKAEAIAAAELPDAQTAASITARSSAGLGLYDDGANGIFIADGGILTMEKQSMARGYLNNAFTVPGATHVFLPLDTEVYDVQGELDVTRKTGTATATSANHLVDTTANQFVAGDVGRKIWNTTDSTFAVITGYNSVSDVTIDTNIMANGEAYVLYAGRFTALVAGKYLVVAAASFENMADTNFASNYIYNNGAAIQVPRAYISQTGEKIVVCASAIVSLAASDYIQCAVYHNNAGAKSVTTGNVWTSLCVAKIA
jgi:hypothetical protein